VTRLIKDRYQHLSTDTPIERRGLFTDEVMCQICFVASEDVLVCPLLLLPSQLLCDPCREAETDDVADEIQTKNIHRHIQR
jgi:hypothetical protein